MKNLKVINQEDLNDWAKKYSKKILSIWSMCRQKKKHFEEH